MKTVTALFLALLALSSVRAGITIGHYDMAEVRDPSTLETRVIEDWKPLAKDPALRSKLIEINIGEWWPGQKVRLPVTLLAPVDKVCTNLLIENTGLQPKVTVPTGAKLRLLKEHGVGLVFIGMVPITDMEPVGQLHLQMEERFVQTKDTRYTPAWIWGLSDMRALTAAIAEKDVFQPTKVMTTGGSKRGVATAASCIADDRMTAMMPVVAPILDGPGRTVRRGHAPVPAITAMNERFLADMPEAGRSAVLTRREAPVRRAPHLRRPSAPRAGAMPRSRPRAAWPGKFAAPRITSKRWEKRGRGGALSNQGSNDNVAPASSNWASAFRGSLYVMPGGQHGGARSRIHQGGHLAT